MALGFTWRRVSAVAAGCSIATGLATHLGLELAARPPVADWLPRPPLPAVVPPAAVALAASFAVLLLVTFVRGADGAEPAPDVRELIETP